MYGTAALVHPPPSPVSRLLERPDDSAGLRHAAVHDCLYVRVADALLLVRQRLQQQQQQGGGTKWRSPHLLCPGGSVVACMRGAHLELGDERVERRTLCLEAELLEAVLQRGTGGARGGGQAERRGAAEPLPPTAYTPPSSDWQRASPPPASPTLAPLPLTGSAARAFFLPSQRPTSTSSPGRPRGPSACPVRATSGPGPRTRAS